jgi:hypothetical protein
VTADNASNNDKMIEHLATLIDEFPGAANQTRCFTHILNLVAKNVLRQFDGPKTKGAKVLDDAARGLAELFDELEDDEEAPAGQMEDGDEGISDEADDIVDDNEDGLQDERDEMTEDELTSLEASVKPVRVVLTKASLFELRFKDD